MTYDPEPTPTPKTIVLRGNGGRHDEHIANGVIKPGELLGFTTDDPPKVDQAQVAGAKQSPIFAKEAVLNQGGDIDTDYADGDVVFHYTARPGDIIFAWLLDGEVGTPGLSLVSNGDGALKLGTAEGTEHAIAELMDTLSPVGANGRVRVRIN